jgi:hypothetical protein
MGEWGNGGMGECWNAGMRECGNGGMRECGDGGMREWGNAGMGGGDGGMREYRLINEFFLKFLARERFKYVLKGNPLYCNDLDESVGVHGFFIQIINIIIN